MNFYGREIELIAGGKDVSGLRIAFTAAKSLSEKPNACEIRVWNLAPDTIAAASAKGAQVMLSAGYEGERRLLFVGDMDTVATERSGPDTVTRMEAGDGISIRLQRQFEALKRGLNPGAAIERLAGKTRVAARDAADTIRREGVGAGFTGFVNGLVSHGPVSAQIGKMAEAFGFRDSVQDGRLSLIRDGETDGRDAVVLKPSTGLVGSPVMGRQPNPLGGTRDVLRVRSLLNGDLAPGRAIHVQSAHVDGWYRVEAVRHVGDTHGQDWYSDVEATPL